jgi:hypothetical protein
MKLFRDEENFLRHWMYDEVHYHEGRGTAKTLQVEHGIAPADLGILIAAAMPDPAQQEAAGFGPAPKTPPTWPWIEASFAQRVAEAREVLRQRVPQVKATTVHPLESSADIRLANPNLHAQP